MLRDNHWIFSEAQDIATTAVSTNVKTTTPGASDFIDLGSGQPMYAVSQITVNAAGGTSCEFQFISASNSALSTGIRVHATSGAILTVALLAGLRIPLVLMPGGGPAGAYQQFVGFRYVCSGTFTGAGMGVYSWVGPEHPPVSVSKIFDNNLSFYP